MTDQTAALYDAIDAFQRTHRLPGLQHAQIRGLLAEHLARALPAAAPVPPPADQTALRQRIRRAICEAEGFGWDTDMLEPDEYGEVADAVMAVLPEQTDRAAEAERPLSPDYEHPECGFHWHGRDGMDIPIRDGQPVCPRCELRRAEKLLAHRERRCQELREECLRRGKNVLARSLKIVALERQLDEVRSQLGAEILRAGQAETELRRVAAEEQPAAGCWCGHPQDRHWAGSTRMTFPDGCHDCRGWNGAHVYGQELPWADDKPGAERPAVGEQPETQEDDRG